MSTSSSYSHHHNTAEHTKRNPNLIDSYTRLQSSSRANRALTSYYYIIVIDDKGHREISSLTIISKKLRSHS